MTRVWPALWPPWNRTTISARSDSQSTILPLPSSPHWAPTTATLPMISSPGLLALALAGRGRHRDQRGDGDPALGPQRAGAAAVGPERHQHPAARRRLGQRAQDRVGVEG